MIIEGKHLAVGQGIFVSDIQEGSAAEQVIFAHTYNLEKPILSGTYIPYNANISGWIASGRHDPSC